MSTKTHTIVIIGAGFSGTILAARLLRGGGAAGGAAVAGRAGEIVLINRSGPVARGVAYGTRSPLHVLNVPAGRMSAFAEDEDQFLNFCRARDPQVVGGSFVPRSFYGDYLHTVLEDARAAAPDGRTLRTVVGEVVDVSPVQPADDTATDAGTTPPGRLRLLLRDGGLIDADAVVIASGNYAPADVPLAEPSFYRSERYVKDPWAAGALDRIGPSSRVLLIGTGLTMFDMALELNRRGVGEMLAVSRRGLMPQPHRSPSLPPAHDHLPPGLLDGPPDVRGWLHSVRRHVRDVKDRGIDWRDVIASLRSHTPALWQRLDSTQRRRFMARVRPFWEVHRHRAAPGIWAAVKTLIDETRLRVMAGRIEAIQDVGTAAKVGIRPRGAAEVVWDSFDFVVNCTGPDNNISTLSDPLIRSLIRRGLARGDELGMGLLTDDQYRLLPREGQPQPVFLLGPLLRGKFWEATAVPELREHARRLASVLAAGG